VGALAGSAALAVLLDRGKLAAGLVAGSLAIGAATAFPAAWPVPAAAYVAWLGMGFGYTIVEVVARTLQQRLCSDEVLARVYGSLETARLGAMALGAIGGTGLAALLGTRGALLALAALLPAFVVLRWGPLRSFEMGVPVEERAYSLLRGDPIFEPLPVAILERLSHDLILVEVGSGEEIISQGGLGDRFYLIDRGEVAVFKDGVRRGTQGPGESFGEIALVRDLPRTATVRATEPVRLLTLQRDRFITAVTGHLRSSEAAQAVAEARL
jgi:MFS family permease